jgi:hypothetical protein
MTSTVSGAGVLLSQPARRLGGFLIDLGLFVVTLGLGWIVWSVFEARASRTPGMRLTGQTMIDVRSGHRVNAGRVAMRQLVGVPVAVLLGLLTCGVGWAFSAWLILSPSRQALWDRVARTTVAVAP